MILMPTAGAERGRRSTAILGALAVAAVLIVAAGFAWRLIYIHSETGEWRLAPSSAPARLSFEGREYDRAEQLSRDEVADGVDVVGETDGGGDVLSVSLSDGMPTVVYVIDDSDDVWSYELVGGP